MGKQPLVRGEHHDDGAVVLLVFPDVSHHLEAIHVWHLTVEQDQTEGRLVLRRFFQQAQGCGAIGSLLGRDIPVLQGLVEDEPIGAVVVNNEYLQVPVGPVQSAGLLRACIERRIERILPGRKTLWSAQILREVRKGSVTFFVQPLYLLLLQKYRHHFLCLEL